MSGKIHKAVGIALLIAFVPWVLIFGAVGWAALDSMICWARYGAGHTGVEGTRWLFDRCG